MTILQAAILGTVQGLTEFLPISSSGHLCLAQNVLGLEEQPSIVAFDVALHAASVLAILVVFARRLKEILLKDHRFIALLAIGTAPAVLIGGLWGGAIKGLFGQPAMVACALLVTGICLVVADYLPRRGVERSRPDTTSSLTMGIAQALAMTPGLSRSGLTITGGMACGLERRDAFEFSFLMAIPAILGAAAYELMHAGSLSGGAGPGPMAAGLACSFVFSLAGLLALRGLLLSRKLKWLGGYCFVIGGAALCWLSTH